MAEIAQFRFNGFVVDPTSRLLFHNGKTVATTSRVFETLLVLLKNRGKVVSKDALMAQIWPDAVVEESNLVQNIYTLRKILGEKPDEHKFIVTVPGRGYSFVAPVVEIEGVPRRTRLARVPKMVWVGVALAAAAAVLAAMYTQRRMPGALHPVPVTSFPGAEMWPTFSPDGGRLAFMWNGENGDNWDIYIRLLGTGSVSRLTTHPGVDASPAWSPDGRFVAFLRCAGEESGFYIVPALGGVEQKVAGTRCSDMPGRRLDWLHGSQSLVISDLDGSERRFALFRLDISTGARMKLFAAPAHSWGDGQPSVSPDGRLVAFVRRLSAVNTGIFAGPAAGGVARTVVIENQSIQGLAWTTDSRHIIFAGSRGHARGLWKAPVTGGAASLVAVPDELAVQPAVARNGTGLVYAHMVGTNHLYLVDLSEPDGLPRLFFGSTLTEAGAQYSPDGRSVAFLSTRSGSPEIWVGSAGGTSAAPVAPLGDAATGLPRWSPDGSKLTFDNHARGGGGVWVVNADGSGLRRLTTAGEDIMPTWSADGAWIYYAASGENGAGIFRVPSSGGRPERLTSTGGIRPLESPGGKWIYNCHGDGIYRFPSDGGPESEVLRPFPTSDWSYYTVTALGLYYLDRKNQEVRLLDPETGVSKRVLRLRQRPADGGRHGALSLSPDHRRLLIALAEPPQSDLKLAAGFR